MALKPFRSCRLRERVTIQTAVLTPDGGGGQTTGWGDVATVWAAIEPATGGEAFAQGLARATQFYRIEIRYRADVTAAHRLVWRGLNLNIRTSADPDGNRERLLVMAESGVADG